MQHTVYFCRMIFYEFSEYICPFRKEINASEERIRTYVLWMYTGISPQCLNISLTPHGYCKITFYSSRQHSQLQGPRFDSELRLLCVGRDSHGLSLSTWVSSRFSNFLPPPSRWIIFIKFPPRLIVCAHGLASHPGYVLASHLVFPG